MLQRSHAAAPVTRLLPDSRALVASAAGGRVVVLLPLDWIRWTAATEAAIKEIDARARQELGAQRLEMVLTGRVSERASQGLTALGWTVSPAPATGSGGAD